MLYLYFTRTPRVHHLYNGYGLPWLGLRLAVPSRSLALVSSNCSSKVARATTSRILGSGLVSFSIPAFLSRRATHHTKNDFQERMAGDFGVCLSGTGGCAGSSRSGSLDSCHAGENDIPKHCDAVHGENAVSLPRSRRNWTYCVASASPTVSDSISQDASLGQHIFRCVSLLLLGKIYTFYIS